MKRTNQALRNRIVVDGRFGDFKTQIISAYPDSYREAVFALDGLFVDNQ